MAVLVGKVDKLDTGSKDATAKTAEAAGEAATKLQAIKSEVNTLKVALGELSQENETKFQKLPTSDVSIFRSWLSTGC